MSELTLKSSKPSSTVSGSWLTAAVLSAAAFYTATRLASRVWRKPVNLRGKIALITGGSRGLGLAIAHELGSYGCDLALCARDANELEEAATRLRGRGIDTQTFPCDITKPAEVSGLVQRVVERFGRLDILVNNAGLINVAPLDNIERSDFDAAMDLMFWAPVNLTFAVLPLMRKQAGGGHIVNITSVGGRVAVPHLLPYCCAKFALTGFSTGLSTELNPEHVHVLTVVPGLMRTGSYLNVPFKGQPEKEFAWFGLIGNLPGFSVSGEYAAKSIREALQRRQMTCTISLPAKLLIQAEALLPEVTRTVMQVTNEFVLPRPSSTVRKESGKDLNRGFSGLFHALTALGQMAARRWNQ